MAARLNNHQIQRVLDLASDHPDWSERAISRLTGLSKTTVGRIVSGEIGFKEVVQKPTISGFQSVPVYRCPGCGKLVTLDPCMICKMRKR